MVLNDGLNVVRVDVVCYTASITRTGLDDSHVSREVYREKTADKLHLAGTAGRLHTTVHSLIGQHVDIFSVHRGSLGNLKLLQVAAQGGLRKLETLIFKSFQ